MTLHIRLSRHINGVFSLYDEMRATPTLLSSEPTTPKLDFFTAVLERLHHGSHQWLKRSQNPCFAALNATKHGHSRALQLFSRQSQRDSPKSPNKPHNRGSVSPQNGTKALFPGRGRPTNLPLIIRSNYCSDSFRGPILGNPYSYALVPNPMALSCNLMFM